jgi:hypothetical protein
MLHIDTAETTKTTANDKLNVQLVSTGGTVLATLGSFSNLDKGTGYTVRTALADVSRYQGQTVSVLMCVQSLEPDSPAAG